MPKGAGRRKEEVPPETSGNIDPTQRPSIPLKDTAEPHATEPPAGGTERIQVAFGKAPLRAENMITSDRKTMKTTCEVDRRHDNLPHP